MSNILSIDLDFILHPCIRLYDDLVSEDMPYQVMWGEILHKRDCSRFLSYSKEAFSFIMDIIEKIPSPEKYPVVVTPYNVNILSTLDTEYKTGRLSPPFNIFNIDHHHCLGGTDIDRFELLRYGVPNSSNWVYFLERMKILDRYFWISNKNSMEQPDNTIFPSRFSRMGQNEFRWEINMFDAFIITTSIHYFPPQLKDAALTILAPLFNKYNDKVVCPTTRYDLKDRLFGIPRGAGTILF